MASTDEETLRWLQANFGDDCIAPLTGTDARALVASTRILELWNYDSGEGCDASLGAFATCVLRMQPHTRELAYHLVARVLDWHSRPQIWVKTGLPKFTPRLCLRERKMELAGTVEHHGEEAKA